MKAVVRPAELAVIIALIVIVALWAMGYPVATSPANVVDLEAFRQIANWLWSPLLGFIGGLVALRLYHRRERQDGQRATAT